MPLTCGCEAWRVNEPKVNGPIILQSIRAGKDVYDGAPFKFCPWCGQPLVDKNSPGNPFAVPAETPPVNLTSPVPLHCDQCHAILWQHIGYNAEGVAFTYFYHECPTRTAL